MDKFSLYLVNIFIISLPLAIFEILIEKDKGWGSGWLKNKWHAKPFAPKNFFVKFLVRVLTIEYPLNYHFAVFAVAIPAIFILEYFYWSTNIMVLIASFISVLIFEDLFWFLFNWSFDSRRQLLRGPKGNIWWHKRWVKISKNHHLPLSYLLAFPVSLLLLLFS